MYHKKNIIFHQNFTLTILSKTARISVNSMLSFISQTCRNGQELPSLKCHHWLLG